MEEDVPVGFLHRAAVGFHGEVGGGTRGLGQPRGQQHDGTGMQDIALAAAQLDLRGVKAAFT